MFTTRTWLALAILSAFALPASAQTFRVQCPERTTLHPPVDGKPNPSIKCQQISGGDGFATMADGTQTYLFAFGPLSGLRDIYNGLPGTQSQSVFMQPSPVSAGAPSNLVGMPDASFGFNGAIGLTRDPALADDPACAVASPPSYCTTGLDGYVDARAIMDVGVMNGSEPAPLMAIDEDDEFFLTLTNVGQVMRPDLFEQHTVHFHGYPNASAYYDGVPDASAAINIGGSFTYYYLAPDAGTYFWHCHITPPEHLQMGMVGQLYVRPRQNRAVGDLGEALFLANKAANLVRDAAHNPLNSPTADGLHCTDILCTGQTPAPAGASSSNGHSGVAATGKLYAYNDGDGSTAYDVEYPLQMMSFDPNFHFVGMTFNPEAFTDLKDKYFMLNGRGYPDTITEGSLTTQATDGTLHASQPLPSIINIPAGGRALLRISDLNVTEYHTLASLGIPMHVIAINARLLRAADGTNMAYDTNSITLGGGESLDVILDATNLTAPKTFYLYTPQLDHLSNDAENFGGMMTEVNVCATVNPVTKIGTGCRP